MAAQSPKQFMTGANIQESKPQACGAKRLQRARRSELQGSLVPMVVRLTPTRLHDMRVPKLRRQRLPSPRSSLGATTTKRRRRGSRYSTRRNTTISIPVQVIEAACKEESHTVIDLTGESHDQLESGGNLSLLTTPLKSQGTIHEEGSNRKDNPAQRGSPNVDKIHGEASSSGESCGTASKRATISRKREKRGRPGSASTKGPRRKSENVAAATCEDSSAVYVGEQQTVDTSEIEKEEDVDSVFHVVSKMLPLVRDSPANSSDDLSSSGDNLGESVEPSVHEPVEVEGDAGSETDYGALELEYCPLTPQQKLVRRLARQKQLEEMRVREAAMARQERFLRRQGVLKERKRAERRIKWKRESDLVQMFFYSPTRTVEDSPT